MDFAHKSTGVNSISCSNAYLGNAPTSINDFILFAKALFSIFFWNIPSLYLFVIFPILKICASNPSDIASNIKTSALYFVEV